MTRLQLTDRKALHSVFAPEADRLDARPVDRALKRDDVRAAPEREGLPVRVELHTWDVHLNRAAVRPRDVRELRG